MAPAVAIVVEAVQALSALLLPAERILVVAGGGVLPREVGAHPVLAPRGDIFRTKNVLGTEMIRNDGTFNKQGV